MRGIYTANIIISGLSTAKTLMSIRASSSSVIEIYSAQITNLDVETVEQWSIGLYRISSYGSPTGTSITPEESELLDSASVATILGNLTAEPSTYATIPLDHQGTNNLSGYRFDPIPELRPIIGPSAGVGLRILTAPSSFNASVQITYREIG